MLLFSPHSKSRSPGHISGLLPGLRKRPHLWGPTAWKDELIRLILGKVVAGHFLISAISVEHFHPYHVWAAEVVPCQSIIPSTALCLTLLVAEEAAVNQTHCSGERRLHRQQAEWLGRSFCRRCPGRRMPNTSCGGRKSREALLSCHCCSSSSGLREDPSTLVDGPSVSCC